MPRHLVKFAFTHTIWSHAIESMSYFVEHQKSIYTMDFTSLVGQVNIP